MKKEETNTQPETDEDAIENFLAPQGGGNAFNPQALAKSRQMMPNSSDKPFLTFKDGEWSFGADYAEVEAGSLWAINPSTFQFGLIEWLDSKPGAQILLPMGEQFSEADLVLQFDTNDKDHQVAQQCACEMQCLTGADKGVQLLYKPSTKGGVTAITKIVDEVIRQSGTNPDFIVPIVLLESSHYMHKKYRKKTYVPVLNIELFDNNKLEAFQEYQESEPEEPAKETKAPPASRRRTRK